jgi:alpha-L-fucosidase 2
VKLFPAIPGSWQDVSFEKLRTRGAFLVSAGMEAGKVLRVIIFSETGGVFRMENPFPTGQFEYSAIPEIAKPGEPEILEQGKIIRVNLVEGQEIVLTASQG